MELVACPRKYCIFHLLFAAFVIKAQERGRVYDPVVESVKIEEWEFQRVDGKSLIFKDGTSFETPLYDLAYIGKLETNKKAPYFILSGKTCSNCGEFISIYVISPADGPIEVNEDLVRYSYPGIENEILTNQPVFKSRLFYKNCWKKYINSIIWLQEFEDYEGAWKESLYIVQVVNDGLQELNVVDSTEIENFKSILKNNNCLELEGIERTVEP